MSEIDFIKTAAKEPTNFNLSNEQLFSFSGTTSEYFRIWIVNIALTIITLGIYSPWAKVRKKKYFYNSTSFMDSTFDYVADPLKLLYGRMILLVYLGISTLILYVFPSVQILSSLLTLFIYPWLVVKSLKFKAKYSVYRNIKFGFDGEYGEALKIFSGWMILVVFTIGLLFPYQQQKVFSYIFGKSRYGNKRFGYTGVPGDFYKIYMTTIGVAIGVFIGLVILTIVFQRFIIDYPTFGFLMPFIIGGLFYLFVGSFLYIMVLNQNWSNVYLQLDDSNSAQFKSSYQIGEFLLLILGNVLGIIFSFGLLIPWASIRYAQYRAENIKVIVDPDKFEHILKGDDKEVDAVGEEFSDFFDFDIGI